MKRYIFLTVLVFTLLLVLGLANSSSLLAGDRSFAAVNGSGSEVPTKRLFSEREIQERIREFLPDFRGDFRPDQISCNILDGRGSFVTTVNTVAIGDRAYFLEYNSGGARANVVEFITIPLFEGSPLDKQLQRYLPAGDDTDIITPFGIPDWAFDATSGPWALIVKNDLGDRAMCLFEVVP
jgi:hypothetical protein